MCPNEVRRSLSDTVIHTLPPSSGSSVDILLNRLRFVLPRSEGGPPSKRLEEISVSILKILDNDRETNPAYKYLAPYHNAEFPGDSAKPTSPPILTHTREAFVELRAGIAAMHPEIELKILDTASCADEKQGKAKVWITGSITQYEDADLKTHEAVAMLEWRKFADSDWTCIRSVFTHGQSGIQAEA